jgi:hypothetical protein
MMRRAQLMSTSFSDSASAAFRVRHSLRSPFRTSVSTSHPTLVWGDETDVAFIRLAHLRHEAGARSALATHDPVLREALLASLGPVQVEMLFGVRRDDIRSLTERGVPTRLYVPFGGAWFRYWMRRLAEAQGA